MNAIIDQRIDTLIDALLPHGAGPLTDQRLRTALEQIAILAYGQGRDDALLSLRTIDDAAAAWGVTPTRARAHLTRLHARWGVGAKQGGIWLLTADEIKQHAPGATGRPRRAGE